MPALQNPQQFARIAAKGVLAGRLRDADSLPQPDAQAPPDGAPVLNRWNVPAGESASGLLFLSIDGNPRHGVLGLLRVGRAELLDAIEIFERQGFWLVMPDRARARLLASQLLVRSGAVDGPRSSITCTPDRRSVFFNTRRGGAVVTLVEQRKDGDAAPT